MGAMQEEIKEILSIMEQVDELKIGSRTYYSGNINNTKVVVVFSRWGKVAAASTVTTLIHHFKINELIFTGVAGAIHSSLRIGDIVIGNAFYQHDMDARPIFEQFEIPLLNKTCISIDKEVTDKLYKKLKFTFENNNQEIKYKPSIQIGAIASGDMFFSSKVQKQKLQKALPEVLCVEMEGAAVAQVCYENQIPFTIIRTISDDANDESPTDFQSFIKNTAGHFSKWICEAIIP